MLIRYMRGNEKAYEAIENLTGKQELKSLRRALRGWKSANQADAAAVTEFQLGRAGSTRAAL